MLSRCLLTKFKHRSSVGSLLRVRCRLGRGKKSSTFFSHLSCQKSSLFWTCQWKKGNVSLSARLDFCSQKNKKNLFFFYPHPPENRFLPLSFSFLILVMEQPLVPWQPPPLPTPDSPFSTPPQPMFSVANWHVFTAKNTTRIWRI